MLCSCNFSSNGSFKRKILMIDPEAFITIIDVSKLMGKGFMEFNWWIFITENLWIKISNKHVIMIIRQKLLIIIWKKTRLII